MTSAARVRCGSAPRQLRLAGAPVVQRSLRAETTQLGVLETGPAQQHATEDWRHQHDRRDVDLLQPGVPTGSLRGHDQDDVRRAEQHRERYPQLAAGQVAPIENPTTSKVTNVGSSVELTGKAT